MGLNSIPIYNDGKVVYISESGLQQKLTAILLCLGEPPMRFLWCWCSSFSFSIFRFCCCIFICRCSSFCCCSSHCFSKSSLTLSWTIIGVFTPHFIFSVRPIAEWFARNFHLFNHSILPRALRPWVAILYPQAFFTLCSFTDILTSVCQGFPWSRQFFLKVCRTSYWSWKHRPGPSVCLIHIRQWLWKHLWWLLCWGLSLASVASYKLLSTKIILNHMAFAKMIVGVCYPFFRFFYDATPLYTSCIFRWWWHSLSPAIFDYVMTSNHHAF